MKLNECKGAIQYAVIWPFSKPIDAWKVGRPYTRFASAGYASLWAVALFLLLTPLFGGLVGAKNWLISDREA